MLRLFIGLDVPLLAPLGRAIDQLAHMGPSVRPVRPDALHITLRFLGDVDPQCLDPLAGVIDSAVQEGLADGWLMPFDLVLTHIGTFPKQQDGEPVVTPRVVFAEPSDPGPLPRLTDLLDTRIDALGLPIPPRDLPMHAHITLARIKRRRSLNPRLAHAITQLINDSPGVGLGSIRVKAVKLIESRPGAHGPDYIARHTSGLRRR
jgi:RNA 2',3'-cyclic 3'-phosphodiesterase